MKFRSRKFIFLTILILLLFPAKAFCQETGPSVSGKVINGTPNGKVPAGMTATLQFFTEEEWGNSYETTVEQDGSFVFKDLSSEIGNSYVIYVEYLGAVYTSPQFILDDNDYSSIEIVVYETTESTEDILINELYFLIYPEDDLVQITEVYQIINQGAYTFTGSPADVEAPATFRWTPPEGARNVKVSEPGLGQRFFQNGDQYYDSYPIRPQPYIHEVVFSYEIPSLRNLPIKRQLEFPVQSIYITGNTERFSVAEKDSFQKTQTQANEFGVGDVHLGGPYASEEEFSFTLELQQAPSETLTTGLTPDSRGKNLVMGISAFIIAVIICIAMIKGPELSGCPEEIKPEIRKIIALEDQVERNEISKADYKDQRNRSISKIMKWIDGKNI